MYVYTIRFRNEAGLITDLDYICDRGQETVKEREARANERFEEIKKNHPTPDRVTLNRRLMPGI